MADNGNGRRSKRARQAADIRSDAGSTSEHAGASTSHRPTAALEVIQMMKERVPPIVPRRGQPPKLNIVACAIAMSRGERFESDAHALQLFGVAPRTEVRKLWVEGKLAELAPAGLGVPGEPALPAYLLDRGKPSAVQPAAISSSEESDGSDEDEDEERRQERRQERREDRWSCSGAAHPQGSLCVV
jgi:hypothetical protein